MKKLILGGVKSGKSNFAESQAQAWEKATKGEVLYIATAQKRENDRAFINRIEKHQAQRPNHWQTLEEPIDISAILAQASGKHQCIILECLSLWVTNLLEDEPSLTARIDAFCLAYEHYQGEILIVSNETGWGIMPMNELARRFGDEMGVLHQRLAVLSDEVVMVVAGLPQILKKG